MDSTASITYGVIFHAGTFYAILSTADLSTSTDGMNWTKQEMNRGVGMILHDGTQFVAFEDNGPTFAPYLSPDAVTWTEYDQGSLPSVSFTPVAHYVDGTYLLFESNSGAKIHSSTDLITWQTSSVAGFSNISEYQHINKLGNMYYYISGDRVIQSPDLRTWALGDFTGSIEPDPFPIISRGDRMYGIGESNNPEQLRLIYSDDGITWQLFGDSDASVGNAFSSYQLYTGGRLIQTGPNGYLASMVVDLPAIMAPSGTSFADWATANSLPMGLDGPTDDADMDGVINYAEFAIGTDPNSAGSAILPSDTIVTVDGQKYAAVQYVRSKDASGATIEVEAFTSLDFTVSIPTTEVEVMDLGNGTELVTVRVNNTLANTAAAFFKTKVVDGSGS